MKEIEDEGQEVQTVDVDKEPEIAKKYTVQSIPTIVAFKDSKEVGRESGSVSKETILSLFN